MKAGPSKKKRAFTITELMVTILISMIVVLSVGFVLVDNQRGWHHMYRRVHSEVVTDAYVARRTFESVARKSSIRRYDLANDGQELTLYYYHNLDSDTLDRDATFYREGDNLYVKYRIWTSSSGTLVPYQISNPEILARDVYSVNFDADIEDTDVRMVLKLDNGREQMTITSSAVRHNN